MFSMFLIKVIRPIFLAAPFHEIKLLQGYLRSSIIYRLDIIVDVIPKCDRKSNSWEQLAVASELEYDIQDILVWGQKPLIK